jgi:hypothetical protein
VQELDPGNRWAAQAAERLAPLVAEQQERMKVRPARRWRVGRAGRWLAGPWSSLDAASCRTTCSPPAAAALPAPAHCHPCLNSPQLAATRRNSPQAEMLGKLKELGNGLLGKFGLSLDNFSAEKDPATGGYSIKFGQ